MGSQWRQSFGGASGLDYAALPAVFRFVGVPKRDRPAIFEDIRVMESAALEVMRSR